MPRGSMTRIHRYLRDCVGNGDGDGAVAGALVGRRSVGVHMPLPSSCNLLSISTLLTNLLAIVTIDGGSFALSSSPTLCPPSFHRWFGVARRTLLKSVDALRSTVGGWLRMLGGEQWPFCIHLRLDLISGIRHPARCTYTLRESNALPRIAIPAPAPPSLCTEMYRDCVAICGAAGSFPASVNCTHSQASCRLLSFCPLFSVL